MSVLVYIEANGKLKKAALEATFYASKIAAQTGSTVTVLAFGDASNEEVANLGNAGAAKVLKYHNTKITAVDAKAFSKVIEAAAKQEGAKYIVFSNDLSSKAVAPRLSVKFRAGIVSGATKLPEISGNTAVILKPVFSGKAYASYELQSDVKIITVNPNSIPVEKTSNTAAVADFAFDLSDTDFTIKVKEIKKDSGDHIALPEADLVVSAGRGLKGPENWGMIEELAKTLGAATACSRPVADIGWRPHHEHVGQTGLAVRPNLYIAIGISGAIQHLAGVNQSKTIVVINTDKEAPFFKAADYGVVGDAFEVIPKLTEALKKFKSLAN